MIQREQFSGNGGWDVASLIGGYILEGQFTKTPAVVQKMFQQTWKLCRKG